MMLFKTTERTILNDYFIGNGDRAETVRRLRNLWRYSTEYLMMISMSTRANPWRNFWLILNAILKAVAWGIGRRVDCLALVRPRWTYSCFRGSHFSLAVRGHVRASARSQMVWSSSGCPAGWTCWHGPTTILARGQYFTTCSRPRLILPSPLLGKLFSLSLRYTRDVYELLSDFVGMGQQQTGTGSVFHNLLPFTTGLHFAITGRVVFAIIATYTIVYEIGQSLERFAPVLDEQIDDSVDQVLGPARNTDHGI